MKPNSFEKFLGSGFGTGYIPIASGTWGSLAALLIYLIPGFEKPVILIPSIIVFTIYGIMVGNKFEAEYGKDPAECTIDEVVGQWIALLFLPKVWWIVLLNFLVWRAFDIVKPYPAGKLEKLDGGLGIMIDDVVSSIYVAILFNVGVVIARNYYSIKI